MRIIKQKLIFSIFISSRIHQKKKYLNEMNAIAIII